MHVIVCALSAFLTTHLNDKLILPCEFVLLVMYCSSTLLKRIMPHVLSALQLLLVREGHSCQVYRSTDRDKYCPTHSHTHTKLTASLITRKVGGACNV